MQMGTEVPMDLLKMEESKLTHTSLFVEQFVLKQRFWGEGRGIKVAERRGLSHLLPMKQLGSGRGNNFRCHKAR